MPIRQQWRLPASKPTHKTLDKKQLQNAVALDTAQAQQLRAEVDQGLSLLPSGRDPEALTTCSDDLLMRKAARIFTAVKGTDGSSR